jgi:hypothetical protein
MEDTKVVPLPMHYRITPAGIRRIEEGDEGVSSDINDFAAWMVTWVAYTTGECTINGFKKHASLTMEYPEVNDATRAAAHLLACTEESVALAMDKKWIEAVVSD